MSWKEESLLAGEPWGAKRRDGAVSPGGAQQPGHREGAAQKALCTMREEKATQSHGREQPCLHCSHLPGQSCYAGGNLSFSPGLLFGRIRARGQPVTLACFPFAQFLLFPVSPSCDLWQSHPKYSPKPCQGAETESSQAGSCARTGIMPFLDFTPFQKDPPTQGGSKLHHS